MCVCRMSNTEYVCVQKHSQITLILFYGLNATLTHSPCRTAGDSVFSPGSEQTCRTLENTHTHTHTHTSGKTDSSTTAIPTCLRDYFRPVTLSLIMSCLSGTSQWPRKPVQAKPSTLKRPSETTQSAGHARFIHVLSVCLTNWQHMINW